MKVLVTGASSLIGVGVARALTERGDSVISFQRTARAASADELSIDSRLGDVRDLRALNAAASGCDAVVHLAAKVGVVGSWDDYRSVNVDGTANVVEAARTNGVSRMVHVSSPSVAHSGAAIIGAGADPPVLGRPTAKAMAENLAVSASADSFGVVVVRPHLVWGPGDTQLVGRIVERARAGRLALVNGGRALVDTTYIDNAVGALVAALDAVSPGAPCAGRAYVIANGEPRPIRDLVSGICEAAGAPFAPRDVPLRVATRVGAIVERVWPVFRRGEEPPLTAFLAEQLGTAHWFDPAPAALDLGWQPAVSIDEGLARLAAWYESFGQNAVDRLR
jgi:2-alkyl-3-oxoalkanoate reductase